MMQARYVGASFGVDGLSNGKVYDILSYEDFPGALRVIDDSGEDYLYSAVHPRPVAVPDHPGGHWEIVKDDEHGTLSKVIKT